MVWCEANAVDYVLGLARNPRLIGEITAELALAESGGRSDRQDSALLQGLPLPDPRQLEPPAPGRRQGRAADGQHRSDQRQPALRRDLAQCRGLAGTGALRAPLLRPW